MGSKCYFCSERDRVGYWSYYCEDCAMLDYKITQEIKKIVNNDIETKVVKCEDDTHIEPVEQIKTRSKRKELN